MKHRTGLDRSQTLMFPERLEDYIAPENPVRFLDAFVAQLDLAALGFARTQVAATGSPPYDPAMLLKLYLYGYLHRIRSSPAAGSRMPTQRRSDLADGQTGARPQDHRRFPQGQRPSPSGPFTASSGCLPPAEPVRGATGRAGRHQTGRSQQQGRQLQRKETARIDPAGRCATGRVSGSPGRGGCRRADRTALEPGRIGKPRSRRCRTKRTGTRNCWRNWTPTKSKSR